MGKVAIRQYDRAGSAVFLKTHERFGSLSNMAGGFPIHMNGLRFLTSEALYQVCRFPHMPEVQDLIIRQTSPMTAKMRSKPYRNQSREDWLKVRVRIMRWCLSAKLVQNRYKFSRVLLETGDMPIVEESRKDTFWGAAPAENGFLVGANVLGRLLMELRDSVKDNSVPDFIEPLDIPEFKILGLPIRTIESSN